MLTPKLRLEDFGLEDITSYLTLEARESVRKMLQARLTSQTFSTQKLPLPGSMSRNVSISGIRRGKRK